MIKLSIGIYIARLTDQFWASKSITSNTSNGRAITAFLSRHLNSLFYAFLGLSYVAVVISEVAECRPFNHYWQVTPTPSSSCRVAIGNLLTMGILDILTDLTLVALPLPMILSARLPAKTKVETLSLMLIPLVSVGFTCYRLPSILASNGSQRYRTLLASIDILISTACANALVVISFLQDRGFKKPKYRYRQGELNDSIEGVTSSGVELESMDNARSLHQPGPYNKRKGLLQSPRERRPMWGSDEDLMRDDSPDGRPSTYNTSARDVENESSIGPEQLANVLVRENTYHLSPYQSAETSIVAARRAESDALEDNVAGLAIPPPSQQSQHQGIVVKTSWKVDISEK